MGWFRRVTEEPQNAQGQFSVGLVPAEPPLPFLTRILQGGSSHAAAFAARGGPAWSVCLAGSFAALQLSR